MAARTTSPALTPALIAKMSPGGRGARGALNYDAQKEGARLLWTNLEGTTPRQWARGMKAFLSLNPRCRRGVDHVSLSLDPRLGTITDEQFVVAVKAWLSSMGYGDRAVVCHLHTDEPQLHVHLVICRIDAAGKVHADGGNWKRSHVAAVHAAEVIGLKPLPPRPDATRLPAPTDRQIAANKRAGRRGTKVQNHGTVSRIFDYVVSKSANLEELESAATQAGLEVEIVRKSGGQVQGLNVRATGADEWLKASNLKSDRSLAWTKVAARLASNLDLRERATAQAAQVAVAARERAEQRVAARLDKQPQPVSQLPRALSPVAITEAKEATMTDTTLDFLNPTPPRPADVPQDDARPAPSAAPVEAEDQHKRKQKVEQEHRDRGLADQVELDNLAELKKLSVRELLDLKSSVSPVVLTAAAIEALVNWLIRMLTLGLVRRVGNLSGALSARARLQELAEAELDRRRRSPASVAERKAFLQEYSEAMQERSMALQERAEALDKRRSDQKTAGLYRDHAAEAAVLRSQLQAGLDRRQVANGHETIGARRAAHHAAVVAHRAARDLVPVGFTGLLITKSQRDAAAAAKAQAALTLRQAVERRAAAKAQLQLLLDEVEEAALKREQEAAEHAAAASKADKIERDALARELRALPDQIREVGVAVQRVQHQERAVALIAEHNRPKTPAELEAVEAERLRQLELANRRG